jgi:ubiquinone/menaquinone biosynthesis C-methylase UbiE
MKRIPQRELLDEDAGTPAEIAASLRDLRHINQWFGGVSTAEFLLRNAIEKAGLSQAEVLEVAAGTGFCIRSAAKKLHRDGIDVRITGLDRRASHMSDDDGMRTVVGDALALPFPPGSFDFVSSCLFMHHLSPDDVVRCINESLRVCRYGVLINDLNRGTIHLGLVYLGLPLFRSRITWNDAPASVRQAYTPEELAEMIKRTSASRFDITNRFLYRIAATIWK